MLRLFCIIVLFAPISAHAFAVKNLDDKPHTVEVMMGGTNITRHVIKPGITERFTGGNGKIRMAGQPDEAFQRAFFVDIFAIWDGGVLHRQMRQKQRAH